MKLPTARVSATGEVVMAYILLALGVAISLAGLAAMATGYPMIEIERGWAMLITGAVLLSGGLVVVAMGIVVRHLIELRGAFAKAGALPGAGVPQAMEFPTLPTPADVTHAGSPAVASPATRSFGTDALIAGAVPAALAGGALLGHEAAAAPHDPHVQATDVPQPHGLELPPPEGPEANVHEHDPAEPATAVEPEHPRSSEELLDQAFSAFDYEMTRSHPPAEGSPAPEAPDPSAAPAQEAAHAAPVADAPHQMAGETEPAAEHPHDLDPPHADAAEPHKDHTADVAEPLVEAPATAPTEPDANLAVIGRYDSEGTSYVMYSDGSIEAQSESGVYRFSSMAELKAFIEG